MHRSFVGRLVELRIYQMQVRQSGIRESAPGLKFDGFVLALYTKYGLCYFIILFSVF
jgi:hypothetical protein